VRSARNEAASQGGLAKRNPPSFETSAITEVGGLRFADPPCGLHLYCICSDYICGDSIGLFEDTGHTRFSCPLLSLDSSALPASLEFGDLLLLLPGKLPRSVQAAAIPPDFILSPGQKHSGLPALLVGFVVASVSACCR
jgi:hypothetical protein